MIILTQHASYFSPGVKGERLAIYSCSPVTSRTPTAAFAKYYVHVILICACHFSIMCMSFCLLI